MYLKFCGLFGLVALFEINKKKPQNLEKQKSNNQKKKLKEKKIEPFGIASGEFSLCLSRFGAAELLGQ